VALSDLSTAANGTSMAALSTTFEPALLKRV
jgi:hypothetical protein